MELNKQSLAGAETRRDFIKKAAATAAVVAATNPFKTPVYGQSSAPSAGRVIGANDRIVVGYIGIGPDNTPGRRRRALTINRCLEWIGCGHHRGGSRRLFQEIPACLPAGQ